MTKTKDELPEQYTQAQLRQDNRARWDQHHAFGDQFADVAPNPGTITSRNHPNAVPVPAEVGGTGRAAITREHNRALGHAGPLGEGERTTIEKGEPRQTASGLRPISASEVSGEKISTSELAAYSHRADRNYSGAGQNPARSAPLRMGVAAQ
jgi:hypothetical protein